jgi:hypothetical protein
LRPDLLIDGSGNLKLGVNTGEGAGGFDGARDLRNPTFDNTRLNWREVIQ